MDYARLIAEDQKVEDPAYISALTAGTAFTSPTKPKWKWHLHYLDLGLIEKHLVSFCSSEKGQISLTGHPLPQACL